MSLSINPTQPREEQIRKRAYEIYLARRDQPGDQISDWLAAERDFNESSDQPDTKKMRAAAGSR
jgi:hypothetical protein